MALSRAVETTTTSTMVIRVRKTRRSTQARGTNATPDHMIQGFGIQELSLPGDSNC